MAEVQIPLHQKTMTGKYPPKNILEIRGFSGASKNSIKIMEKPSSKLKTYAESSVIRINSENDNLFDQLFDLIEQKPRNSWNEESNGWTSGNMSERSSVYSIDDGDFDREASRKVNGQLREIEAILYEQNHSSTPILHECNEWIEKFPHLRVLGLQMPNIPKEEAFSFFESTKQPNSSQKIHTIPSSSNLSSMSTPLTNQNEIHSKFVRRREPSDIFSLQNLCINGSNISVKALESKDIKNNESLKFLEEELIEEEGSYEELLAYDNREDEYLLEHNKRLNLNKRRRRNLPPISPKAAIKDVVSNMLFDYIWSEIIDWSSDLIKQYATLISPEFNETINSSSIPTVNNSKSENALSNSQNCTTQQATVNQSSSSTIANTSQMLQITPKMTNIHNIQFSRYATNNNNTEIFVPQPPSRDSTIYIPSTKVLRNNSIIPEISSNAFERNNISSNIDANSDPVSGFDNFLKIQPLTSKTNVSTSKKPSVQNSRIGSGNRKQYSTAYNFKKRLQTISDSSYANKQFFDQTEKNIVVQGAAVVKPISFNNSTNENSRVSNNNNSNLTESKVLNDFNANGNGDSAAYYEEEESNYVDQSMAIHVPHIVTSTYYSHTDYDHYDDSNSFSNVIITNGRSKPLPPIEPTSKKSNIPLRISSANNSRQSRDRNERPMTTTATRFETSMSMTNNKRSTTPLMQIHNYRNNSLTNNNLPKNIQITGVKFSGDDSKELAAVASKSMNLATASQIHRKSIQKDFQNLRISNFQK